MPSEVGVTLFHGAFGSPTNDIGVLYYRWADNNLADNSDPIIPGAGTVYSWAKIVNLRFTVPPDNQATNLRFFSDAVDFGGTWTGVSMLCGSDYNGIYIQGNSSDQSTVRAGFANYLEGSPFVPPGGSGVFFQNGYVVPGYALAYNVVMQISVARDMLRGQTDPQVQSYRYSET